jgi:hypothetical protein
MIGRMEPLNCETEHPRQQQQIQWRRDKVQELNSKGHSQREIASFLQIGIGTVNRDLVHLRQQAKENIKKYVDERLPEEYEKCLVGLNSRIQEFSKETPVSMGGMTGIGDSGTGNMTGIGGSGTGNMTT